jgi:hypothetical protein
LIFAIMDDRKDEAGRLLAGRPCIEASCNEALSGTGMRPQQKEFS